MQGEKTGLCAEAQHGQEDGQHQRGGQLSGGEMAAAAEREGGAAGQDSHAEQRQKRAAHRIIQVLGGAQQRFEILRMKYQRERKQRGQLVKEIQRH